MHRNCVTCTCREERKVVKHLIMQLYLRVPHSLSLIERDPAYQLTSVSQSITGTCQVMHFSNKNCLIDFLSNTFTWSYLNSVV